MRSESAGCSGSISDDLAVLRAEAAADRTRRGDPLWLRGVKYTFVTAVEAGIDVAQHVCASKGWDPPRDNGDAARLLGVHGVLPLDLADRLRRAVGFRNVLVHRLFEPPPDRSAGSAGCARPE